MRWLLEPEVFNGELTPFIEVLKESGEDYTICEFGESYEEYISDFITDDVVFHGSYQFARLIKEKTKWKAIYCNFPKFECNYYYPKFGDNLLNSDYLILPFGDMNRKRDWLFTVYQKNLFIKPVTSFKKFTGMVLDPNNWNREIKLLSLRVDPEELILITRYTDIIKEWRLVIADGKIITGCEYAPNRISGVPELVQKYAQDILNSVKYNPDPIWILDICEWRWQKNKFSILETGPFACSGLYACDPKPIIETIKKL